MRKIQIVSTELKVVSKNVKLNTLKLYLAMQMH